MVAVDTNVLVRYLTGDHPQQSVLARKLIDASEVWVPLTVVLETEWVLRGAYGFPPGQVAKALRGFAGLPTVSVESPDFVAQALDRSAQGMDFADALHLAAADRCEAFVTFDRALVRAGKRVGADVRQP